MVSCKRRSHSHIECQPGVRVSVWSGEEVLEPSGNPYEEPGGRLGDFRKLLLRQWYASANYRDWPPAGFHQRPEPGQHLAGLFRCQLGQLLHRPARLQRQKVSVSGGLESRQRRSILLTLAESV